MKYKKNILIKVLILFIVIEFIVIYTVVNSQSKKEKFLYQTSIELLSNSYDSVKNSYYKLSKSIYSEAIDTKEVIGAFRLANKSKNRKKNREKLFKKLNPLYSRLKKLNLEQLHFHLKNSRSFLRFYRPSRFGDDLSTIRYSVKMVNRDKISLSGFEEGRIFSGIRYVFPLFYKKSHIGSVETSVSLKVLKAEMEKILDKKIDFMVRKSIIEKKVWKNEQNNYFESALSNNYLHKKGTTYSKILDKIAEDLKPRIEEKLIKSESFSIYSDKYLISFLSIPNIKEEAGAVYIISYSKSPLTSSLKEDYKMALVFVTILNTLFSILLYYYLFNLSRIRDLALNDSLTKIPNRKNFEKLLEDEIKRVDRYGHSFCAIYFDVDYFKKINDSFGRKIGDRVLVELTNFMNKNIRKTDTIARWGGEEFLILVPETTLKEAISATQKLKQKIQAHKFNSQKITITCSFGITEYKKGESIYELLDRVDKLLEQAKDSGRNRVMSSLV